MTPTTPPADITTTYTYLCSEENSHDYRNNSIDQ